MEPDNKAFNPSLDAAIYASGTTPSPLPPDRRTYSSLAIASLTLGILSLLGGGIFIIPPILAVIFGHMALRACNRDPLLDGKAMAVVGLVLGWFVLVAALILIIGWIGIYGWVSTGQV
jgi:hypothetical protein